jgi:hypothetical protein
MCYLVYFHSTLTLKFTATCITTITIAVILIFQCYALSVDSGTKENIGYVMLDLRTAKYGAEAGDCVPSYT